MDLRGFQLSGTTEVSNTNKIQQFQNIALASWENYKRYYTFYI